MDNHDDQYSIPRELIEKMAAERARLEQDKAAKPNITTEYLEQVVATIFSHPEQYKSFILLPTAAEKLQSLLALLGIDLETALQKYRNPEFPVEDYLT